MSLMRARLFVAVTVSAAAVAAVGATVAWADFSASNGGASQVTATTATLNGTESTTDKAAGDSAWYFRYGKTTAYGANTKVNVNAASCSNASCPISVQITGLDPGTVYHFQLVVAQNINYSPAYSLSSDASFTTATSGGGGGGGGGGGKAKPKFGKASLKNSRLKVNNGKFSIRFGCKGASGASCKGKITVSAHGTRCASGKFSSKSGRTPTVKSSLSRACKTLLHNAPNHQLGATLRATFSTHQSSLKKHVTLLG